MKCISLWQPWASLLVLHGPDGSRCKANETRHWPTRHRGRTAIHAAKRWTEEQRELCFQEPFLSCLLPMFGSKEHMISGLYLGVGAVMPLGAIVGHVDLIDCKPVERIEPGYQERAFGNYDAGRFAWITEDPHVMPPLPLRGQQGIWELDPDTTVEVLRRSGRISGYATIGAPDGATITPNTREGQS